MEVHVCHLSLRPHLFSVLIYIFFPLSSGMLPDSHLALTAYLLCSRNKGRSQEFPNQRAENEKQSLHWRRSQRDITAGSYYRRPLASGGRVRKSSTNTQVRLALRKLHGHSQVSLGKWHFAGPHFSMFPFICKHNPGRPPASLLYRSPHFIL